MKIAIVFATLLAASTLAADGTHVFPFAPTTATPIEVHYLTGCVAREHSIRRDGGDVIITALDPQCPAVLPIPLVEKVKLPEVLPVGEYRVSIYQEHEPFFLTGTDFVVRNGGAKPFELHPSSLYVGDAVPVHMTGVACDQADCSDITVRVDGQAVAIAVAGDGAIVFTPPNRGQGLADVTVQKADFVMVSPGALYYHLDGRDRSAFEPILFPVLFSADGAFGSKWRTEATVSNPAPWTVYANYTLHNIGPCVLPCDPPLAPKSIERFHDGYPRGTVMFAPRSEAGQLALSLRIRDVSREEQGYGTEIPVVREHDFIHGQNIHLLDVPLDPRYRVKVRVYMIEPVLPPALGGEVRLRRGNAILSVPFTFSNGRDGLVIEPHYAEVDLPLGSIGERVNVEVFMPLDATGWAFATVTNNETQQVTIVAP
ncbi:MAG TPA: hypothetical protein VFP80_01460 [Thermoanaerobaculia bacterium]|nr:hypothetical protein [Thermoanaerobaculia bacterium]